MKTPADPSPPRRPRVPPEGLPSLSDPRRSAPAPCALGSRLWAAPGRCCWPGGAPWLGAVALGPWVLVCGADAAEPAETPHCGAWRGAGRGSCVGCRLLHTHVHTHTHTHTHNTRLPQRVPDPQSQLKPPTTLEGESRSLGLAQGTGGQRGGCVPGGPGRGETGTPTAASPTGETPGWRSWSSALWPGPPRPPAPQAGWRVLGSDHICFFLSCGWLKCRAVEGPFKRLLA